MLAEQLGSHSQLLENVKEEVILSSKVGEIIAAIWRVDPSNTGKRVCGQHVSSLL